MTEFKDVGYVKVEEYTYDFAVDGGATGSFELSKKANEHGLPIGCIVEDVVSVVVTEVTSDGAASAKIGYTGSLEAYVANIAVGSLVSGYIPAFPSYSKRVCDANQSKVLLTITGAPVKAGKIKVMVKYLDHA